MKKSASPTGKSKRKTTPLQRLALVLFGLSLLFLVELVLRVVLPGGPVSEDPFVGFSSLQALYVPDSSGARMVTAPSKRRWFNPQDFPRRKAPGAYRIFSLGGSTTYGHPFADSTSFNGWTRFLLNDSRYSAGGRKFEVINAGGISYASYRVVLVLEEVLDYDPDLVVIYTGHNEFLEARTYGSLLEEPRYVFKVREQLGRLRTYNLLAGAWRSVRGGGGSGGEAASGETSEGKNVLSPEVRTMLDQSAGLEYYRRDSTFSRGVFEHFRFNVARMIQLCRKRGVKVVFMDPLDNTTAFSPFKSQHREGLSSAEWGRFNRLSAMAQVALAAGQPDSAAAGFRAALEIDPLYAETHFYLGEALLAQGDTSAARPDFVEARELDVCPLRAPEPIHAALAEETSRAGVTLLDLETAFRRRSPGGLLGRSLFEDHIHPTPEGNLLIALELLDWLKASGAVEGLDVPSFEDSSLQRASSERLAALSPAYYSHGLVNLAKVLIWAKKFREARSVLERNWTVLEEESEAQYLMGSTLAALGERDSAVVHLQRSQALEPGHPMSLSKLARVWADLGRPDSAGPDFERYLSLYPQDPEMLAAFGMLLGQLGRPDQGLSYLNRAARYAPGLPELKRDYGLVFTMLRQYDRARAAFLESQRQDPGNPEINYDLGLVAVYSQRMEEAEQYFKRAVELDPGYLAARINLGNVYEATRRPEQAEEQFRLALVINPGLAEGYISLAHLYQTGGRAEEARKIAQEGLARIPGQPQLESFLKVSR